MMHYHRLVCGKTYALIGLLAAVAGIVPVARAELPALVVAQGVVSNLTLPSGQTQFSSAQIHGILNLTSVNRGSRSTLRINYADTPNTTTYVDLGPDEGDQGQFNADCVYVYGNNGNVARCSFRVGTNGGGANARLTITPWGDISMYYTDFELCANAKTDAEVFDVMTIDAYCQFRSTYFSNSNAKPMRVTFTNTTSNVARDYYGRIGGFWDNSYFRLFNAGGDIILRGSVNAPIYFYTQQTNYKIFYGTPKALLRTEGPCDVILDCRGDAAGKVITINATNLVWGHTGDFICTSIGGVKTGCDKVLPYGPDTGIVRVEGSTNSSKPRQWLDLNGTTQCVNGVVLTNGGCVSNSASKVATLIFGAGNADGEVSGNFKETNINYLKTGSGTLTLGDVSFPTLAVDGGTLNVTGNAHVVTLALTNVVIIGGGTLTCDNIVNGENVSYRFASAETNVVTQLSCFVAPIVKTGAGFITCETPENANNQPLEVSAGVLRFGAASTTNAWWRFIARKAMVESYTFTTEAVPSFSQTIYLGLGNIGLFNASGCCVNGTCANAAIGAAPTNLGENKVTSSQTPFLWNTATFHEQYSTTAKDPILGGGTSGYGQFVFVSENFDGNSNWYDIAATSDKTCKISTWADAVLFTNGVLRVDDPSTWVTNTWRLSTDRARRAPTSYSLRRMVNNDRKDVPHVTDWTLESSPDGITWETMDIRSNQTFSTYSSSFRLSAQFNYTYNAHIPYVFSAKNDEWHFTTFGAVKVAAGATLDLSELKPENIAINALAVDLAAGAGTIRRFVPAETGVLTLENVSTEQLSHALTLPLALSDVSHPERLAAWAVDVNGAREERARIVFDSATGRLKVRWCRGVAFFLR